MPLRDALFVVVAVEKLLVYPPRPLLVDGAALCGERIVLHRLCHLLCGAECAEVPEAHLRVRPVVVDVHRVVLLAVHEPRLADVPSALAPLRVPRPLLRRNPRELQRLLHLRPDACEPFVVAAYPPIAVGLHYASHLPVGGDASVALRAERQRHAEVHRADSWVHRVVELHVAHRPREVWEEARNCVLVVPYVSATPPAGSLVVEDALPAEKMPRRDAEHRLALKHCEVGKRGLFHRVGRVERENLPRERE